MGLTSSGDEFCARTNKALSGIPGVHKLVDDILDYGENYNELLDRIKLVFERCQEWGITLSKDKYQFGSEVKFAGYIINEEGTKPDPKLTAAISEFPAPTDLTKLRSFMGLVNRFTDFAPDLKHAMVPLQGLLSKKNAFLWGEDRDTDNERGQKNHHGSKGTNPQTLRSRASNPVAHRCIENWDWIRFGAK